MVRRVWQVGSTRIPVFIGIAGGVKSFPAGHLLPDFAWCGGGSSAARWTPTYPGTVTAGRAFFVYTGLRILLLLGVGALLYATGARGFLLVVLAFLVSGALSLVWLDRPRAKMSQGFGNAVSRVNDKIDAAAAAEDEPLDEPVTPEASEQEADAETESRQQ